MNKEEIATTYEEYKNGFKLVAGLGRLSCYQGLDYLEKLLEKDKFYSEELEDTIVFIESHINRIEKENQKYKEVIFKIKMIISARIKEYQKKIDNEIDMGSQGDHFKICRYEENIKFLKDILKEVE